jgi:hypothetical protein
MKKNLYVFLIIFLLLLLSFSFIMVSKPFGKFRGKRPNRQKSVFHDPSKNIKSINHLVIVPGHAIHKCRSREDLVSNKNHCWTLLDYQKNQIGSFLEHLRVAIEIVEKDPTAMLMLSGGQTRPSAGPRSESASYLEAIELMDWFGHPSVADRVFTEDYARDSLQNLLFCLCRFFQITGSSSPRKITIVGFPFKAARFNDLHRKVMRLSPEKFEYIGVGDENAIDDAYQQFEEDIQGCGETLKKKRYLRNPFRQVHPYQSCPHYLLRESCHLNY